MLPNLVELRSGLRDIRLQAKQRDRTIVAKANVPRLVDQDEPLVHVIEGHPQQRGLFAGFRFGASLSRDVATDTDETPWTVFRVADPADDDTPRANPPALRRRTSVKPAYAAGQRLPHRLLRCIVAIAFPDSGPVIAGVGAEMILLRSAQPAVADQQDVTFGVQEIDAGGEARQDPVDEGVAQLGTGIAIAR
ncbi:MAG TPA: hypothetical protein VLQ65_06055 [Saliniramus sp.]|nr:hypothetical protein [Saliniramus sp.]